MSTPARVPAGVPAGGQFATEERPEPNLTLASSRPTRPTWLDALHERPNRYQAIDLHTARLYAYATDPAVDTRDRVGAAREAVSLAFEVRGRFVSLPEDDDEATFDVLEALRDDAKVSRAVDAVGDLADYEARSFGARVAGVLADMQAAEREERVTDRALVAARTLARPAAPTTPPVPIEDL